MTDTTHHGHAALPDPATAPELFEAILQRRAMAFVIDFGGFNWLFYGPLEGRLATSKIISGVAAALFAWIANRMWTFRHRRSRPAHHEAMLFFLVNGVGLILSTVYLNVTHDLLHMDSRLAVNVNAIIGIGLATIFRFWAYRQFVFSGEHPGDPEPEEAEVVAPLAGGGEPGPRL